MIARRLSVSLASLVLAACGDSPAPTAPATTPVDLAVTNALDVPVRLSVDGMVLGNVGPVSQGRVAVPAGHAAVTWAPFKRTSARGATLADDFDGGTIGVAGPRMSALITNAVRGELFFTPVITNASAQRVGIAIADLAGVRCLGAQDPADALGTPVAWGYYRLTPVTTLRVYPTADCTGDGWAFWPTITLRTFAPNTGAIALRFPGF